jgi:hypothetical protein
MSFTIKQWIQHRWLSPEPAHHAHYHSMVYDKVRKESVLFGGGASQQTWVIDNVIWEQKSPVFSPVGRRGHVAAWDSLNERMLIFGGSSAGSWGSRRNDTDSWDGTNWTEILAHGAGGNPGSRVMAGGCYDANRQVFIIAGGWYGTGNYRNVSELDVTDDSWTSRGNAPWEARSHCRLCYNPINQLVYLVGGYAYPQAAGSYRYRDTWQYDGTNWTELSFSGNDLPSKVNLVNSGTDRHFDLFWDSTSDRMYLISNYGSPSKIGLFYLDTATPAWVEEKEILLTDVADPGSEWSISEVPLTDLHEADSTIYCFFSPSQGSESYQTWSLESDINARPPELTNQNPAPGDTRVILETNISLDIIDDDNDVDTSSVILEVDGTTAWQNETSQPGFTVNVSTITDGYRYKIKPDADLDSYATIRIDAYAYDAYDNYFDEFYTFRTIDTWPCEIENEFPAPGENNANQNTLINVDIFSRRSGIDFDSIEIQVDGQTAYDSYFILPYDGYNSSISSTIIDGYDGYNAILDKTISFVSSEQVFVEVFALNKDGY